MYHELTCWKKNPTHIIMTVKEWMQNHTSLWTHLAPNITSPHYHTAAVRLCSDTQTLNMTQSTDQIWALFLFIYFKRVAQEPFNPSEAFFVLETTEEMSSNHFPQHRYMKRVQHICALTCHVILQIINSVIRNTCPVHVSMMSAGFLGANCNKNKNAVMFSVIVMFTL